MIKRILIPTDGYGLEDHVIRYIAKAFQSAEFYVVSIVNTHERGVQLTNLLYQEMKESAQNAVEHAKLILSEEGASKVQSSILEGIPSISIIKFAKNNDIDLIALRVYNRKSTASAQRLGSTIKNVLQKSTIPILTLANECNRTPIKKILFATDGTKKSERAKNFSILFSSFYDIELQAIHILTENETDEDGEEIIKNINWKASFMGAKVKGTVRAGEAVEQILQNIKDTDIVIIGIGRRFLIWHYIGHVTQAIITHSQVPVILVPYTKKGWKKRV